MTRPRKPVLLAAIVAGVAGLAALASGSWPSYASEGVTIGIRYSHFEPTIVTVKAGEPVTITLRNDDPIGHEWIVGSNEVHQRHRLGNEPFHDRLPTEVTVPPFSTRTTTIIFEEPGEYAFVCHLPGHEAYGMRGTLSVIAPDTSSVLSEP